MRTTVTTNYMSEFKYTMTVFIWTLLLSLSACTNPPSDLLPTSNSAAVATDSMTLEKDELTKLYTQAIAEFIQAAHEYDNTTFDTLFFGKRAYGQADDFPDIELPRTIEKTQIRLVDPELGQNMQQERKYLVYINMMGWIEKKRAEFMLVIFSKGAEHQYDYFIHFTSNSSKDKFELDKIEFENFVSNDDREPERVTIFNEGKYIPRK